MEESQDERAPEAQPEERPPRRREWSGGLRSIVLPIAALAVIIGGLWYWDSRGSDGGTPGSDSRFGAVELPAGRNPTGEGPAPEVGRAGPDFILETLDGETLRLSDLQGKPVVLNFWATWCPPCRDEIPELVAAYDQYRDQGLVIVGVNLQEPDGNVREFAEDFGIQFPVVIDRNGDVADKWRLGGPVQGIPTSYFLDEAGVVREFFYGPMKESALNERLGTILP